MIFQPTNVETPRQSQHSPNSPPLFCTIRIYITALLMILNIILCWLNIVIADLKAKCCNPPLFGAAYANLTEVQLQTCHSFLSPSQSSQQKKPHWKCHIASVDLNTINDCRWLTGVLRGCPPFPVHLILCRYLRISCHSNGPKKRLCTTKAAYWISQGGLGQVNIRIMRSLPLTVTLSLKDSEPHSSAVTSIPSPALIPSVTAG